MTQREPKVDSALEGIDESKRETLNRLVKGGAFVAPVVASFAMQGISIRAAHAQPGSSSNVTRSDIRLKRNVVQVGSHPRGFGIYRFNYLWSDVTYRGVMAQEVLSHVPEAVKAGPDGYLAVDYDLLGMSMTEEPATEH
jgi:hypothetical protein